MNEWLLNGADIVRFNMIIAFHVVIWNRCAFVLFVFLIKCRSLDGTRPPVHVSLCPAQLSV